MDGSQLYQERLTRIRQAIALEKPDRVPISLYGTFFLKYGNPEAKLVDFVTRPEWADDMVVQGYRKLQAIDAGGPPVMEKVENMGKLWLAKARIPGRELRDDDLWQIDEVGLMTVENYDTILKVGWKAFMEEFLVCRLGYRPEDLVPDEAGTKKQLEKYKAAGLVNFVGGFAGGMPFDVLSGGRGMAKFFADLHRIPDKVEAVIRVMAEEMAAEEVQFLRKAKPWCVVAQPCVRANSAFVSRKVFERFGWPLFKKFTDIAIAEGVYVLFHMDARWDGFLDFFTDFPRGMCIFDPDGQTDIFKVKQILGDRMCITGDVSPSMLAVATPDEVYRYSRKLIEEIGPSGFILSSGCAVPPNAKPENVEALVAAAIG
jgi:uroporphyrinogen decarboxylase